MNVKETCCDNANLACNTYLWVRYTNISFADPPCGVNAERKGYGCVCKTGLIGDPYKKCCKLK